MNNSGKVVSAPDSAARVLATASLAQTRCRLQRGDGDVRGKVFAWAGQLHNSTLLISESHTTLIVSDGSIQGNHNTISHFKSTTSDGSFH